MRLLAVSTHTTPGTPDSRYTLLNDPEVETCTQTLSAVQRQIISQWEREDQRLGDGQFVKGRKKEGVKTSLDPKTGNQWLVFGGGRQERTAGLVDAFTGELAAG